MPPNVGCESVVPQCQDGKVEGSRSRSRSGRGSSGVQDAGSGECMMVVKVVASGWCGYEKGEEGKG